MIKSGKEKFYLIFFAIFIPAVVLIWRGIIVGRIAVDGGVNEIKEKNVTIAAYEIREKTLKRNLENYNFAKEKTEEINKYFIDENNLPDIIKEIEYISDQTSNELSMEFADNLGAAAVSPGGVKNSGEAKGGALGASDSYVLKLDLKGTFKNLMQFLARMESLPYYSYIDSITISAAAPSYALKPPNKTASSENLQTFLTIRVFKKIKF